MSQQNKTAPTVWDVFRSLSLPIYLPAICVSISRGMLIPVLPLFAGDITDSYRLIGVILAGEALGTVLSDIPAGVILSRIGMRRTMLVGLFLLVVASIPLFFTTALWTIAGLRVLSGLGLGLYNVTRHAFMAERVPIEQRGKAIAMFGGIFRAGGFIGPIIGGQIAAQYSLQHPFLLYGILVTASAVILHFALPSAQFGVPKAAEQAAKGSHLTAVWSTIRNHHKILIAAGTGQLLAQGVRVGRQTILPLFASDVLGLSVDEIGYIIGAGSGVDAALFFTAGLIMDRWGRKFAIVPSFVIQGVGLILITFTTSFGSLLAVSILLGLGNGISSGTMMTLGADLAPPEERGEFLGTWRLIGDSGFLIGPLAIGGIADLLALAPAAWALGGVGVLASAVFAFFVPETLQKRLHT